MSGREAFGPNLRRLRIQRGISLEELARVTKVHVDLWDGLERNDFSRWPTGIFARAYVREYAHAIGVDPDTAVDDFCRWFPQGDRRAERIVRGQAELVGHALQWSDDLAVPDRRARTDAPQGRGEDAPSYSPRLRGAIALADIVPIAAGAAVMWSLMPIGFWPAFGIVAVAYHVGGLAALGASPAVALVNWYLEARRADAAVARKKLGLRVLRGSERVKA